MENNLEKLVETEDLVGTSLKGSFSGYKFVELYAALGAPTCDKPSGDDKVQIEWIFDFNGEVFTIYDWKTYDRLYTLSENEVWNVGGKAYAGDFIDYILNLLNQNREKC
jgi:hypothetical protein